MGQILIYALLKKRRLDYSEGIIEPLLFFLIRSLDRDFDVMFLPISGFDPFFTTPTFFLYIILEIRSCFTSDEWQGNELIVPLFSHMDRLQAHVFLWKIETKATCMFGWVLFYAWIQSLNHEVIVAGYMNWCHFINV